jgi:hypothetical protein
MDGAARSVLGRANPMSINDNLEYGGKLFQSPSGRFGATAPAKGSDQGFDLGPIKAPPGTTETGNYHTHGDYSSQGPNGEAVRTSNPKTDQFGSDNFSSQDHRVISYLGSGKSEYSGYLGTPSGKNLSLDANTAGIAGSKGTSLDQTAHSLKGGALAGAGLGAAATLGDAIVHGHLNSGDLRSAAENGVAGAALGTAGNAVERTATAGLDKIAGQGVEKLATSALGEDGALLARSAATKLGGTGAAGAVISAGISIYENRDGLMHGDSRSIGNVAGDTAVGAGSALAGAAAGAAIGSIVPVAGTIVGAGVGLAVGYAADEIMHAGGVDKIVSNAVTSGVNDVKSWFGL